LIAITVWILVVIASLWTFHSKGTTAKINENEKQLNLSHGPPALQGSANANGSKIGYAVSVTGCGSDPISEGAAVLRHSIHQSSKQGNPNYTYDYHMYAIVHPNAVSCGMVLEELGYTVLVRDTPVAVKDIQGTFLRENIEKNG
jgi:hypothetical protein